MREALILSEWFFNMLQRHLSRLEKYVGFLLSVSSVTQSCLTLQPHGLQHNRLPHPSSTAGACSNLCPSRWWSLSVSPYQLQSRVHYDLKEGDLLSSCHLPINSQVEKKPRKIQAKPHFKNSCQSYIMIILRLWEKEDRGQRKRSQTHNDTQAGRWMKNNISKDRISAITSSLVA